MTSGQRQRSSFIPSIGVLPALLGLLLAVFTPVAAVGPATAQPTAASEVVYQAVLNGSQAVPPTVTGDAGEARLVLDDARGEVRYRIDLSGIRGQPSAIWIQRGAPGEAGEILLTLAPATLVEGVWQPGPAALDALRQERISVVVPTDLHPAGEVRGDLRQFSLASDRATWGRLKAIFNGG